MARAHKGDYIEEKGYGSDVNTTEVLAVHKKPGKLEWEAAGEKSGGMGPGPVWTRSEEFYLTEYERGRFDLVSEHEVKKVYKGR